MMMTLLPFSVLLSATLLFQFSSRHSEGCSTCSHNPVVHTNLGSLKGLILKSINGRQFYAFRKVPFAKPPIGPLRFQPPLPVESWEGILDATNKSLLCPQPITDEPWASLVNEDCLTLDIYTPKLASNDSNKLLPVLVYIHFGGFVGGSTREEPQRYMDKDIILVIINYRLGPFGFLSTGDSASPGNYGLLDQTLALEWIRDNIKPFGGDANKVTISGQSAGAASVIYHIVSPKSRGLFRGAIAQSGSPFNNWAYQRDPITWAFRIGEEVNCSYPKSGDNSENLVECLRGTSVQDLIDANERLNGSDISSYTFLPVIENPAYGQFLTESPYELLNRGEFHKVPIITGATRDEMAWNYRNTKDLFETIDDRFYREVLPEIMRTITKCNHSLTDISAAAKAKYFDTIDVNNKSQLIKTVSDMYSDTFFKAGTAFHVKLIAAQNIPVFMYSFEYAGNGSTNYSGSPEVNHEDDLHYLFNRNKLFGKDLEMSHKMIDWWTNFVTALNPTPATNNSGLTWEPTPLDENLLFLNISQNSIQMQIGYLTDRLDYWSSIIPYCQQLI